MPTLERYDGAGAYRYQDGDHADRAATLALAAHELQAKRFEGIGAARILRPGARFSLINHASYGANTTAFDYAGAALASHDRVDSSHNPGQYLPGGMMHVVLAHAIQSFFRRCRVDCPRLKTGWTDLEGVGYAASNIKAAGGARAAHLAEDEYQSKRPVAAGAR